MAEKSKMSIESRVQLFSTLAEAAEIEHNFMCLYFYAIFSLKRHPDEGLNAHEMKTVEKWRQIMLGVALEEMTHLSLVSNLFVALGGTPHFMRPNFPAYPGMYPANIVVELARFDLSTLDHFIFLERPLSQEVHDGASFSPEANYIREAPQGRLMPFSGDYRTVGELYTTLRESISILCERLGEKNLFCGHTAQQIGPVDSRLPGLVLIKDKESAFKALDTIVIQGEGALQEEGSHFARFQEIRREYLELLEKNPHFEPSRPVARNPLMRKPINMQNRVWVSEPLAAKFMDLANAFYTGMLRILVQIYTIENRDPQEKHDMLEISYTMMHSMATIGETLTYMPSSQETPDINAGMSFAMVRTLSPLAHETESLLLSERLGQITRVLDELNQELKQREENNSGIGPCLINLTGLHKRLAEMAEQLKQLRLTKLERSAPAETAAKPATPDASLAQVAASSNASALETAESSQIWVSFETKKCMHARHCVTELPGVFKANTPGKWIFPENTRCEELAAVIHECPSGALQYRSKTEALHDEAVPLVNLLRLRENGPYAFLANLEIDGVKAGYRATLCRCGLSKNKPFCDTSHVEGKFQASGEPATVDATELKVRDGVLKVQRTADGPYAVTGNLEICAGTGRVVLRTKNATLCRCGNSRSKPLCDGSHVSSEFRDPV